MCMRLTEMSMHEAFFYVTQAKSVFSPSLWSIFQVKTARYGREEKFGIKMTEAAEQSTQKPPEVTRFKNGNIKNFRECFEKSKTKIRLQRHLSKTETHLQMSGKTCVLWLGRWLLRGRLVKHLSPSLMFS